jgi:small-conductance mechanosensitive channel
MVSVGTRGWPRGGVRAVSHRCTLAALCVVAVLAFLFVARASVAEPPAPRPSSSASATTAGSFARIHDREVFAVKVARNGKSAAQRAKHATEVLEHAVEDPLAGAVHVETEGDVAVLYVGDTPVIQIGREDAEADGDASVAVHAAAAAARVTEAVHAERRRNALATSVFSFSLLVFSGLMVFLALGKLGGLVARGREWVASRPASLPNVRIAGIDLVRPTALRGVALAALDISNWVLRIGLAYGWVLFALSLFEATRAYSAKLTGIVLAPLSGVVGRIAVTMPVLLIGAVAVVVVLLSLRVISLFFDGVARGEPSLSWLPADLAAPTSLLLRIALVVTAASAATPLITGNDEGPLARASVIVLAAIALAMTPILASAAVGVTVLFGRRLKVGDFVELGARAGSVRAITLLGVQLEDRQGCKVHVPHLAALVHPTRVLGALPPVTVEVSVASNADVESVTSLLSRAAEGVGIRGRVELTHLDADAGVYLVTTLSVSATAKSELLSAIAKTLREAGVPLGRPSAAPPRTGPV